MEAVAYSNVRNNLKKYLRKVNEDSETIFITSRDSEDNAVLMSKTDYDNLLENAHIRKSKANVDIIMQSWEQAKAGLGKERKWE